MNIIRMVKAHIKIHGWPSEPVRVGPATCGQARGNNKTDCHTAHAFAEAKQSEGWEDYVFIYGRPCNAHDNARKV